MPDRNRKQNTRKLAVSAVMISLSAALSVIKVAQMPLGGSVTLLSMLPVCMLSIMYGCKHGLICAFLFGLSRLAADLGVISGWGLSPAALAGSVLFDYLAAFTALGLAGLFRRRGTAGCIAGIVLAAALRLLSHIISGTIFFSVWTPQGWNFLVYSLCYNLAYMLPETAFTAAGAVFLLRSPHTAKLCRPDR